MNIMSAAKGCTLSKAAQFALFVEHLDPDKVRNLVRDYDLAMKELEAKPKIAKKETVHA